MTKEQIAELEYQFNYYSRRFALYEDERETDCISHLACVID